MDSAGCIYNYCIDAYMHICILEFQIHTNTHIYQYCSKKKKKGLLNFKMIGMRGVKGKVFYIVKWKIYRTKMIQFYFS